MLSLNEPLVPWPDAPCFPPGTGSAELSGAQLTTQYASNSPGAPLGRRTAAAGGRDRCPQAAGGSPLAARG